MMRIDRFGNADEKPVGDTGYGHQSPDPISSKCKNCDGKRVIIIKKKHENQHIEEIAVKCPICNGSGFTG